MKKLLIVPVFLLGLIFTVNAQSGSKAKGGQKTPEDMAMNVTSKLATKYGLDEDQKSKLYTVTLIKIQKTKEIKDANPNADRKTLGTQVKPLKEQYKVDLKEIMTEEQYGQLQKDIAARKQQKGAGKQGKGQKIQPSPNANDVLDEVDE